MRRSQETFACYNEVLRERAINLLRNARLFDEKGRCLMIIAKRASSGEGASAKRKWHAWIRLMADHSGTPFAVMKHQVKEHLLETEEVVNSITGEVEMGVPSIEDLDDDEQFDLNQKTKALAADHFGIALPDSKEEWEAVDAGKKANRGKT